MILAWLCRFNCMEAGVSSVLFFPGVYSITCLKYQTSVD